VTEPVLRTICDLQELEALRTIWNCWPGTRDSDLDFFSALVRSRLDCQPHVVLITREQRPDAILVGLRERRRLRFTFGCFTIFAPEVNVLEILPGGLRGKASKENCAAFVHDVMRSLQRRDVDMAVWEQLDEQTPLYTYALQRPHFASRDHFPHRDYHWWFRNLPDNLDAFLISRSRSQRSKLRRKYNNVLNHFGHKVQIRCFHSVADLDRASEDMEEIASKTKRRVLGRSGFFNTPQARQQMAAAAEKGCLRIYILYFDEKPAAFWRGGVYSECLHGDHAGYDPIWSEFSPGIFLFLGMIDGLRAQGITTLDLGFGDSQFRQYMGNAHCIESRVRIYAPTLRGAMLNLLNVACPVANECARFLLECAGCLKWARRARWSSSRAASAEEESI
jgi:hypothetical protein